MDYGAGGINAVGVDFVDDAEDRHEAGLRCVAAAQGDNGGREELDTGTGTDFGIAASTGGMGVMSRMGLMGYDMFGNGGSDRLPPEDVFSESATARFLGELEGELEAPEGCRCPRLTRPVVQPR